MVNPINIKIKVALASDITGIINRPFWRDKQHASLFICPKLIAAFAHKTAYEHNSCPMYGFDVQLYFKSASSISNLYILV